MTEIDALTKCYCALDAENIRLTKENAALKAENEKMRKAAGDVLNEFSVLCWGPDGPAQTAVRNLDAAMTAPDTKGE